MNLKQKQLNKHKLIATSLFVLMMIIYISTLFISKYNNSIWIGYTKAFAEAGMVGALADWFAVTALFKYPLGIKIPHTNLINNNKDALGENLGAFVSENFLNQETIRPYVTKIDLAYFMCNWLSNESNFKKLSIEIKQIIKKIVLEINDDSITALIGTKGKEIFNEINFLEITSKGLLYVLENNEHQRLISIIIPEAKFYVENNKDTIYEKVVEKNPILGIIGGKTITNQLISGIISFLDDIQENGSHPLRNEITNKLYTVSKNIQTDISLIKKIDNLKSAFISNEKIEEYSSKIWLNSKHSLLTNLDDENSKFNLFLENYLKSAISNLKQDKEFQNKINKTVQKIIYKLTLKNSNEIGKIISKTIKDWDGKEMSDKLELEVGKDLQFIRINGTIVGGIVGLIIYTLSQMV